MACSRGPTRLFRNNRGQFYTLDCVKKLTGLLFSGQFKAAVDYARHSLRQVRAGLEAPGSSDCIGWTSVIITPEMVGQRVAVFTALEVKTTKGRATADQVNFIDAVLAAGGRAGVVRSDTEALRIVNTQPAQESRLL